MRTALMIPLALTVVAVAGCRGDVANVSEREETASHTAAALERDLTLSVPRGPAAEVASPIELARPKPVPVPVRRHNPRPKPGPAPSTVAEPTPQAVSDPTLEPVTAPLVDEAVTEPAATEAFSGRELAPGKTVTMIPVSNGPSVDADGDDSWLPSERPHGIVAGGGGTCRRGGGGGGIGIAARIRVGVPALHVR